MNIEDFISFVFDVFEKLDTSLPAKCVVHFRPKDKWKGVGYGFDWMRMGDTGVFGDGQPYEDIVSKQFIAGTARLETNINAYGGIFRKNTALFQKLETEYKPLLIPWKKTGADFEKYYCSWLSLFPKTVKEIKINNPVKILMDKINAPNKKTQDFIEAVDKATSYSNTEAELRLYIEVAEKPDYLEFDYPEKYLTVTPKKITNDLDAGAAHFWYGGKTITVKCLTDFPEDQKINVYAVKKDKITGKDVRKLAGRLYVWANYPSRRKKRKVVFVKVKTSVKNVFPIATGEKQQIEKYLRQALLELDEKSEIIELNVSGRTDFNGFIDMAISTIKSGNGHQSLDSYLKTRLDSKYNNYFKAFYFAEDGYDRSGYSVFGADFVVAFDNKNDQTAAHEFMHSLNLAHSFSNEEASRFAKYTYEYKKTDNLLDYSHHVVGHKNDRCALWHWQWIIANNAT